MSVKPIGNIYFSEKTLSTEIFNDVHQQKEFEFQKEEVVILSVLGDILNKLAENTAPEEFLTGIPKNVKMVLPDFLIQIMDIIAKATEFDREKLLSAFLKNVLITGLVTLSKQFVFEENEDDNRVS